MSIGINAYSSYIAQTEKDSGVISTKAAAAAETEPHSSMDESTAAAVKQNYDVVTISEEGKAAAQALNAAPVEGSFHLFLDAVADPSEPSWRDISAALKAADEAYNKAAAEAAEAKRQQSLAYGRAWKSWDAMTSESGPNFGSYDPTTGLYKFNVSAAYRYFQNKRWEWQENLRVNDPEAYEAWVSEHGVMKKPRDPGPDVQDVYQIINLTPDADGYTELDYFHMKLEEMKNIAALIEEQHRKEVQKREEESGEPSAAERLATQNAKLEEAPQTNDPKVFEIQLDMSDGCSPQQQGEQPDQIV